MTQLDDDRDPAGVAELAYQKWIGRCHPGDPRLRDWMEAEAELRRIGGLARQLAAAEERLSGQIAGYERAQRRLIVEHAVARILAGASDLAAAAAEILRAVADGLGWDAGAFWVLDRDLGALRCVELWHEPGLEATEFERLSRQSTFRSGIGLPGRVWATEQPIWIDEVAADADLPRARAARDAGLHGACAFPVRNGGQFLGALEFFGRKLRQPDDELFDTMNSLGSQISQFIERRAAEDTLRRRDEERRLAREIQEGLLPKAMPALAGFAIGGRMWAADTVGGDCFGFFPLAGDCLGILIADASGHGFAAALLMAQVRAYIQALTVTNSDVGTILALANCCLGVEISAEYFLTAVMVRLDPRTRSLAYAGAGHWPGYVLGPGGEVRAKLTSAHLPLGIAPALDRGGSDSIRLEPGELVVMLTDGIPEAISTAGDLFGIDRAIEVVRAHRHRTPDQILESLVRAVHDFSGDRDPTDDMTAIVIKCEQAACSS
jgi:serine phosphatase RsbU (regulator of sigma subunit)